MLKRVQALSALDSYAAALCVYFFQSFPFAFLLCFLIAPFQSVFYCFILVLVFVFKAAESHMNGFLKNNFFNHSLLQLRMLFSRGVCQGKT